MPFCVHDTSMAMCHGPGAVPVTEPKDSPHVAPFTLVCRYPGALLLLVWGFAHEVPELGAGTVSVIAPTRVLCAVKENVSPPVSAPADTVAVAGETVGVKVGGGATTV